jgi:hypothetical protein
LFQKLLHVPEVRKTVVQQTKAKSNWNGEKAKEIDCKNGECFESRRNA